MYGTMYVPCSGVKSVHGSKLVFDDLFSGVFFVLLFFLLFFAAAWSSFWSSSGIAS